MRISSLAELLMLPTFDLRLRFARLGIPLRFGPQTQDEALRDVENALTYSQKSRS